MASGRRRIKGLGLGAPGKLAEIVMDGSIDALLSWPPERLDSCDSIEEA